MDSNIEKPPLKSADPEIRNYIEKLESENRNLQKKIAQLQVKHLSAQNRISALEDEIKKFHIPEYLSDEELENRMKEIFKSHAHEYGCIKTENP